MEGLYLQLLQLTHVTLALCRHVPHLVLVFLLLLQPLCLLPLLLLLGKLQQREGGCLRDLRLGWGPTSGLSREACQRD